MPACAMFITSKDNALICRTCGRAQDDHDEYKKKVDQKKEEEDGQSASETDQR